MKKRTPINPTGSPAQVLRRMAKWTKEDIAHAIIGQATLSADFLPKGLARLPKVVLGPLYVSIAGGGFDAREVKSMPKIMLINAIKGAMTFGSLKVGLLKLTKPQLLTVYGGMR